MVRNDFPHLVVYENRASEPIIQGFDGQDQVIVHFERSQYILQSLMPDSIKRLSEVDKVVVKSVTLVKVLLCYRSLAKH